MLRWIVGSSMRLRFVVLILAAILLVAGAFQLREMPVDVFPEFDPPLVEVQTEALGLSAHEVEAFITTPLEKDLLNGVAWLDRIYSESVAGLSSILLVFEPGTDPIRARQMVQERLTQSFALPNVSKPPTMLQPLSTTSRVMIVGLSSDEVSLIDMSVLAHWTVEPRLLGVPGVANVSIWGQRDWQLQVLVDPQRLNDAGITLQQIIATTGNSLWVSPLSYLQASSPGSAGWIDTPNQRLTLRHLLPISSAEELAQVVVVGTDGVLLGDVAEVVEDHQPLIGDAILGDDPGLLLVIEKFPGANTLEVTRGVEAALEAMRPGLAGIDIDTTVFRPANYIEQATANFSIVLPISALLVFLLLGAFYYGWRAALISLASMLVSLVVALLVLYLRGATFNFMILAGFVIALGVIVDDAIIDVESITRRLRQNGQQNGDQTPTSVIVDAVLEMRSAIVFALLIVILAVFPLFLLRGITGAFFRPLAVSYVLAVLASLLVALIVTPVLSLTLLTNSSLQRRESPLVTRLSDLYSSALMQVANASNLALVITGITILIGLVLASSLGLSLEPTFKETELRIHLEGAPGASRTAMVSVLGEACREFQAIPGVRNCGSHAGRAIKGDQVVGINSGEIWLSLDPGADYDATTDAIRRVSGGFPGMSTELQSYRPERLGEALSRPEKDVVVRLYGDDFELLRSKAEEITSLISGIDGVATAEVELPVEEPQIEIEVDLAAAERHQVKPGDVRRTATTLMAGLPVGNLYEEQKVFDVVVWSVPEIRNNLDDLEALLIETPGGLVPLRDLADVRIASAPIVIQRDATSRFLDVSANVAGRSPAAVQAEIENRLGEIALPMEFHAEVFAESAEWDASLNRVLLAALISVTGIFFLLQAAFQSWRLAALTFLTLPAALVGGVLAAHLDGGVLSLGALFGFLAVLSIAVRNSVVLITRPHRPEQQGDQEIRLQHVQRGATERLTPILMTALTTALALLPFVIRGYVPGNEIIRPMAVIILGGLVTSTLLQLFVLPALFLRFAPGAAPLKSGWEETPEPAPEAA